MIASNNLQVTQSFICPRGFFPSIPTPRHRRNNKSLIISYETSQILSPRSLSKSLKVDIQKTTKQQRVVSNFLLKYLTRKQLQQSKWNTINYLQETRSNSLQNKIDPKFRRVYLKKLKKNINQKEEFVKSRFMIGDQRKYSQLQKYKFVDYDYQSEK